MSSTSNNAAVTGNDAVDDVMATSQSAENGTSHDTADGALLAEAMQEGVSTAYGAVMKPAEGTVLTVSRLAAQRALEAAGEKNDAEFVLDEAIKTGYTTLAETIEMNPVLKKAGVVDAGGKGYLIILEGMLRALRGEPVPEVADTAEEKADFAAIGDEDITFAFDTVFIVRKTSDKPLDGLRTYLNNIGDSLVIGEDDEAFKVHVHTDTPGDALNEAQKYGTLELAKIENMRTQAADLAAGKKAQSTDDLDAVEAELERGDAAVAAPEKRYGFLAVCAGEGLEAVFRDLTVDRIVSGGQTMNPSTEAILQEVNRTPSEIVFILPNNKNIIMAAQQCVGLTEKQVIVVPTATVPQGISAMMAVDPDNDDPQAILAAMTEAAANVTTAQITYAARNSDFDGFAINEGDYLALCDGKLLGTDRSLDVLLDKLAHVAADKNAEFVTVYSGQGVTEDDAARAAFLARFEPDPAHTLLGFAVMGGIFGEGVDLAGDRLIGCAIVGVGLPQVNPRQEMLRRYYEEQSGCGFDYAYRYPGMNKVLQAAGRVVRTPQDKGVVLLLDDRFAQPDTARLFPPHWRHIQYLPGTAALETALAGFWG